MPTTIDMPLLEARGIGNQFASVRALYGVSLTLQRGEVLAEIGEKGAGKRTLMKFVVGVETPPTGEVFINGQPVPFSNVEEAKVQPRKFERIENALEVDRYQGRAHLPVAVNE